MGGLCSIQAFAALAFFFYFPPCPVHTAVLRVGALTLLFCWGPFPAGPGSAAVTGTEMLVCSSASPGTAGLVVVEHVPVLAELLL